MGSLNTDSTRITQSRKTIRNLGAAHSISADRVESSTRVDAGVTLASNADLTLTQYSVVTHAIYHKVTDAATDELVERVAATQDKPATDTDTPQQAVRHTGNRLVLGDSINDDVLARDKDVGQYDEEDL
jgi:hypothetical protein